MPQLKDCTLTPHSSEQLGLEFESTLNGFCSFQNPYCWFAGDVTAAMLVVKNKNNSLLWELNYFFYFFREKFLLYFTTNMAALSRGCKQRI